MKPNIFTQLEKLLSEKPTETPPSHLKHSAVLVPLISNHDSPKVLLTKRAANLPHHADQICFPGGAQDPEDHKSFITTALRESEEEIGLKRRQVELLGCMKGFTTQSGYYIQPVCGIVEPGLTYTPQASEVSAMLEPPLDHFLSIDNYRRFKIKREQQTIEVFAIDYQEHCIWGATAKILRTLALLLKQST